MEKLRSEIDNKYKWDLTTYYKDDQHWQNTLQQVASQFKTLQQYDGKLDNAKSIKEFFDLKDKLTQELSNLYVYIHCRRDEDVSNPTYQQYLGAIQSKLVEFDEMISFAIPQISRLSDQTLTQLAQQYPDLDTMFFRIIKNKPHVLNESQEKLLSGVDAFADSFNETFSNFEDADLTFNPVKDSKGKKHTFDNSTASILLRSPDRLLRKNTYQELKGAYGRFNNFLYSNYLANVKATCFFAKTRNFDSALDQAMFNEEVDIAVYNNLVKNVNSALPLDYKYFELKRQMLGLDKFAIYDVYYNPIKLSSSKFSYEKAVDIVKNAVSTLGQQYVNDFMSLVNNNTIDVMHNKNKRSGAYSTGSYGKTPLVLLNYNQTFNDVSTLAHEMGHSMHTYYSFKNQNSFKADYVIFLAEIASTVNETLLNRYMIQNVKTKQEKLYYLNEFVSTFHATVFRQTMFAEFEATIHNNYENNTPMSAQDLNNIYYELVKRYFGDKVDCPQEAMYEWSSIPHFYRDFYVYKYATGLISAIAFVNNIIKNGQPAIDKYLEFLSSGCKDTPINILKQAGVDLTKQETFDNAFNYLQDYLDQMQQLIQE